MEPSPREFVKFLFNITRPPLVLVFGGTILAGTASVPGFDYRVLPPAAFYSVILSFIVFSINDYFDREIDRENGRRGGIKGEIIEESWQKKTAVYGSILASLLVLASLPFLNRLSLYSVIGMGIIGIAYSVPPIRLKSIPILDSIANGVGVFFFFTLGTGLMGGSFSDVIPAGYWGSMVFMTIDAVGGCPDIETDRKQGVRTSATLLGWRGTSIWLTTVLVASLLLEKWSIIPKIAHLIGIVFGVTTYFKRTEEWFYRFVKWSFITLTVPGFIWLLVEIGMITF